MNSLHLFRKKRRRRRHVYIHSFIYHYWILISRFGNYVLCVIMWILYLYLFQKKRRRRRRYVYIYSFIQFFIIESQILIEILISQFGNMWVHYIFFKRKEEEKDTYIFIVLYIIIKSQILIEILIKQFVYSFVIIWIFTISFLKEKKKKKTHIYWILIEILISQFVYNFIIMWIHYIFFERKEEEEEDTYIFIV